MRLIDAEALKAKWYEVNDIDENDKGARFVGYTEIARLIDQAPTVSAETVHGEWEVYEDIDGEYGICSVCGKDADFSHYGETYNFCPNCGAIMDKGGEEDANGE